MSIFLSQKKSLNEVLGFTYPKLHTGKSWYVDFYSYDTSFDIPKDTKTLGHSKAPAWESQGFVVFYETREAVPEF